MKAAGQHLVENAFANVTERGVPEVMSESDRLHQVFVKVQPAGDSPTNLRHLDNVCQPRREVISNRCNEHLALVLQAAERVRVDNPVAIPLKGRTHG